MTEGQIGPEPRITNGCRLRGLSAASDTPGTSSREQDSRRATTWMGGPPTELEGAGRGNLERYTESRATRLPSKDVVSHPKVQHYVPRFLLAAFETAPGSKQVHAFDKQTGRIFPANVRNVAGETGFYDIEVEGGILTFEPSLAAIEDATALVVARIVEKGQIGFLGAAEREVLARFLLIQNMRTRQFLEAVHDSGIALAQALDGMQPGASAELGFTEDREQSRLLALSLLQRSPEWVPLILDKAWSLYEAPPERPFWISDHPVAMHNNVNRSTVRGTIGLAVRGIEIYLPISPRYCLGFLCPTLRDMTNEAYTRSLRVKMQFGIEVPTHDQVGAMRDGLEYGFSIPSQPENVDYVNSLQVLYGERFVFSAHSDFAMAEEMIANNPQVRHGPRMTVD